MNSEILWSNLKNNRLSNSERTISSLFELNTNRAVEYTIESDNLYFDYSKTSIDNDALDLLFRLVDAQNVFHQRDEMFAGSRINTTENRPVLHVATRDPYGDSLFIDGDDVRCDIKLSYEKAKEFASSLRCGTFRTGTNRKFTDIVNVGIGGSDLGPAMIIRALTNYHDGPSIHFLSNIDGSSFTDVVASLDPDTTLFILASKSFSTDETMSNAKTITSWLKDKNYCDTSHNFVAITSASDKAHEFGIKTDLIFEFGEWIGGRYSIWSSIGLPVMIAIGPDLFDKFHAGGRSMDHHFRNCNLTENLPVLLALVGIWHNQICGYSTRAVVPYEQRLELLPAYLQQLEMESNGKSKTHLGSVLKQKSVPVVWGGTGTNSQHSFFQMLHQGTQTVPCEFLLGAMGDDAQLDDHHRKLIANCVAQSEALMEGRSKDKTRSILKLNGISDDEIDRYVHHRQFDGNRPSTTLIYPKLTPFVLGQLIALYEHRVFVEGAILGINSFDQWGVELGKSLAKDLEPLVSDPDNSSITASLSTRCIIHKIAQYRKNNIK